jgi:phosphate transport system protein
MRTAFHEQLHALTAALSQMCDLAGLAMEQATKSLLQANRVLAEQVITDHDHLALLSARSALITPRRACARAAPKDPVER